MSSTDAIQHHIERCIAREFGGEFTEPDDDGDYCLPRGGSIVWIRSLLDSEPELVRIWSIAAVGVKRNAAALREVNDQNLGMNVTRCFLAHDSVVVSAEAEIEAIVPGQLRRLVEHVGGQAEHVGELIATIHGGERPFAGAAPTEGLGA